MARSVQEIVDAILAEKDSRPELAALSSVSATAVYRLWAFVVAAVIHLVERFFDQYRIDVQAEIDANVVGGRTWWVKVLKEFQRDDVLSVLPTGKTGYEVLDETKRIVKYASYAEQQNSILLLKAAKDNNGVIEPLTAAELVQLRGYVDRVKPPGVKTSVISEVADRLRAFIEVYYNSLVARATIEANVQAAIRGYLRNLDFDGIVYISKLVDAIQSVDGVLDVKVNSMSAVNSLQTLSFDRIYRTRSGYIEPDTTAGFTLANTITYIAQ